MSILNMIFGSLPSNRANGKAPNIAYLGSEFPTPEDAIWYVRIIANKNPIISIDDDSGGHDGCKYCQTAWTHKGEYEHSENCEWINARRICGLEILVSPTGRFMSPMGNEYE